MPSVLPMNIGYFKRFIDAVDEAVRNGFPKSKAEEMKTEMLRFVLNQKYEVIDAPNATTTTSEQPK